MLNNKAKIILIPLLLTGCGAAGGGGSSGGGVSSSSQVATKTYQMDQGGSDWFSSKWAYIDGSGVVGQSYQDSAIRPDEDVSGALVKVIIASDSSSVPKSVEIKKAQDFSLKIPSLAIAKSNKLTLAGTKNSSIQIDILALQGELNVSSGKIELLGNIEVSKDGVIRDDTSSKDGIVFKASSSQKGKITLDGTFEGGLTLPSDFTLKTVLGGNIKGDFVSNGELMLQGGKTLNVQGKFTNNGDVVVDLSDQSPSATPLLKSTQDINLVSGNITVKGGKKGVYTIFATDGRISSNDLNLTVSNGEGIIQDAKTYKLSVTNPSAPFMDRQFRNFSSNELVNDYLSYLRTHQMFDVSMNQGQIQNLSFLSKQQDQQLFYGASYKNKFGFYVDRNQNSHLDIGVYTLASIYGVDFMNVFHSASDCVSDKSVSQNMKSHSFEFDSSLSKKVSVFHKASIIPHFSLLYSKIFSLEGEFKHENRLFTAQADKRGDFYAKVGVDVVSVLYVKSIECETFVSLDVSNKGHDKISFVSGDITISGRSEFAPSFAVGVNAKLSQDFKMYTRTKVQSEKSLFEMGLNIKI